MATPGAGNSSACGGTAFCFIPTGPSAAKGASGPPPPSPAELAIIAASHMRLPSPTIESWPSTAKSWVNFPTWVHVSNWGPTSTSASAGPVTSTVTATPTGVVLSAPDSTDAGETYQPITTTCAGPGQVYDESAPYESQHSSCTLKWAWPSANYNTSGDYPMTVAVTYQVSWIAVGAPGGGPLPSVSAPATIPIHVGEIEAIGGP